MSQLLSGKMIVSGCTAGMPCSHDGRARLSEPVRRLVEDGRAIPVCPEQLSGMRTPRETAEIEGGDGADVLDGKASVVSKSGRDLTERFLEGARRALEIAQRHGCRQAILKARSPSCGRGEIYDGSFSGARRRGDGVTAALFQRAGIEVLSDEEFARRGRPDRELPANRDF
ncbi:MAG: DUF523 domain-containing protein [Actinomycetota bacterium]|nr:DUF523 domain-containing protein [Actinomycetota bacterium]MCL6093143.1 DUF523 domain-containing protein [Actinomycetota bacterium]MDA8167219.1 DUF523 domain-containing protein [Actinomycetota bacterium]